MRKILRPVSSATVLAAAFLVAGAGRANGQAWFDGHFRLPHGSVTFGIGSPFYPAGSLVPDGYRVRYLPRYGYGFYAPVPYCSFHGFRHTHFVPVRRFHRRFVVVHRPFAVFERPFFPRPFPFAARPFPPRHHRYWDW